MQRYAVAFAVLDDSSEAVRADLMFGLNDFAAVGFNGCDGLVQPAVCIQIEQRSLARWFVAFAFVKAPSHLPFLVRQNPDGHSRKLLLLDLRTENSGIESNRPVEIFDRNINPDNLIGHKSFLRRFYASLSGDSPLRGRRNQLGILRHDAAFVPRLRRFPLPEPRIELFLSQLDIQAPIFDVKDDGVAVAHSSDGAAVGRFRRDVAGHETMGGAGKPTICEKR